MPITMPREIGVKDRCPICSRMAIEHGKTGENYVYWGGNANIRCSKCGRLICPIHILGKEKLCYDCIGKD